MNAQLSVLNFYNFRAFLRAHADTKRLENTRWTMGAWAKKLGLKGTSSLTMVINGQRLPGKSICQKLTSYFKFSSLESTYFKDLVRLEKYKDNPEISVLIMERLDRTSPDKTVRFLEGGEFEVISKWYYLVIRELTRLKDFRPDPEWIVGKLWPDLTRTNAREAVDCLIGLDMLIVDGDLLTPTTNELNIGDGLQSEAIKRFHEQMIEIAKKSIRIVPIDQREINGLTFGIKKSKIPEAIKALKKWQDDFGARFEADDPDEIYQLNLQLFPLTIISNEKNQQLKETAND